MTCVGSSYESGLVVAQKRDANEMSCPSQQFKIAHHKGNSLYYGGVLGNHKARRNCLPHSSSRWSDVARDANETSLCLFCELSAVKGERHLMSG